MNIGDVSTKNETKSKALETSQKRKLNPLPLRERVQACIFGKKIEICGYVLSVEENRSFNYLMVIDTLQPSASRLNRSGTALKVSLEPIR